MPEEDLRRLKYANQRLAEEIRDIRTDNTKLEEELRDLQKKFNGYVQTKQQEEAQRLRTALIWAGGLIIGLAGFLWSEVIWPVIRLGLGRGS